MREARKLAGLNVEQMAERLNLRRGIVRALEEDRFDTLPGPTFTRGYLRNYARALKLDERKLLALFEATLPQPSAVPVVAESRWKPRYRPIALDSRGPRRHWGAAAALLVVLGLWGWQQMGEKAPELVSLTPDSNSVSVDLPGGLDEALPFADTNPLDLVEVLPSVPAELQQAAGQGEQDGIAVADASDRLNMRFSADCWVEIKDRDNKVLFAALKRADEQLQIEGRGPFKVLLGFAPGVEMAYNGRPVDIEVPSGGRSARLIVGSS